MLSPLSAILFFFLSTPSEFGFGIGLGYAHPAVTLLFWHQRYSDLPPNLSRKVHRLCQNPITAAVVGNLPAIRQMRTECFPSPFSNDFFVSLEVRGKETEIRCGRRKKKGTKYVYEMSPPDAGHACPKKPKKSSVQRVPLDILSFSIVYCAPLSPILRQGRSTEFPPKTKSKLVMHSCVFRRRKCCGVNFMKRCGGGGGKNVVRRSILGKGVYRTHVGPPPLFGKSFGVFSDKTLPWFFLRFRCFVEHSRQPRYGAGAIAYTTT